MQITQEQFDQIKTLYKKDKKGAMEISKILNLNYRQVQYRIYNLNNFHYSFSPKNYDFFENINTEQKAYWLGFIYADGCISLGISNGYRLSIGLKISDRKHLQKLANIFESELKENIQYPDQVDEYKSIRFELCNKKIFKDLEKCGIKQRKSYEETTNILDCVPDTLKHHFVRGIFDGDGNVGYKIHSQNNYHDFNISGTKDILEKIQKLLIENIRLNKIKIHQMTDYCWKLQYGGKNNIKKFYNWLYKDSTIWLERKKHKFDEILGDLL